MLPYNFFERVIYEIDLKNTFPDDFSPPIVLYEPELSGSFYFTMLHPSNQSLTDIGECVILGQTSSTSESNQIELPDDINNYKLLILMYLSTDGNILNTNIVPIKYFKQTKYRVVAIWTNTNLGAFAKYIDDTHINLYVRTQYSAVLIGVK